jgi:cell filamentation protein
MTRKEGRYSTRGSVEDQFEPGSRNRVLKNIQGIKTIKHMDIVENYALMAVLIKCVKKYSAKHSFTAKDICAIHKDWFGDIYSWAGHYRNVDLSKGDFRFAHARYIPESMKEFERKILKKYTPCNFQDKDQLAEALAIVHIEFILIHPFREGNGRLSRVLADLMALQSGFPTLNYSKMNKNKLQYIKFIHEGVNDNYEPMKLLFSKIIEDSLKDASS